MHDLFTAIATSKITSDNGQWVNSLFFVIILYSRFYALFGKHGTVQFSGGQAVQRIHNDLIGNAQRFLNGFALD